jgi:hypothetical protein
MGWEKAWAEDFKEEAAGSEASLAMVALLKNKFLRENLKEMGPALAILLATLIISTFITEFTFNFGLKALWKTLFRFLRLSLLLTLPMYLLPGICSVMEGVFNPLKNWIIRPFQGIGLSMLLATKLLAFLEIYTGSKISVDTVLPSGKFEIARFLSSIAIGIVVSLLLSVLWTLDDLGIRHFNRKTREVRMIGKYIGLFLPIFFGFYGIISLFENNTQLLVAKYVGQMTVILYPPFVVFNVLHSRYLKRREEVFLKRLKAVWRSILTDDKDSASSAA